MKFYSTSLARIQGTGYKTIIHYCSFDKVLTFNLNSRVKKKPLGLDSSVRKLAFSQSILVFIHHLKTDCLDVSKAFLTDVKLIYSTPLILLTNTITNVHNHFFSAAAAYCILLYIACMYYTISYFMLGRYSIQSRRDVCTIGHKIIISLKKKKTLSVLNKSDSASFLPVFIFYLWHNTCTNLFK